MKDRLTIAGVPVDALTMTEALERAATLLRDGRQHLAVTPNPEMAVLAARDPAFRTLLESSDLALADGFGLRLAARIEGKRLPATVTGADFTLKLVALAEQEEYSVGLLGGERGVAGAAARNLLKRHPRLKIVATEDGGEIRFIDGKWVERPDVTERIRIARPEILLVALGHGKQERWIRDHMPRLPSVRLAMGVGGTLDYLSGRVRRAPAPMRRFGFEWLWRLFVQPRRAPRIFEATAVFLWMVLKKRFWKGKVGG